MGKLMRVESAVLADISDV